MYQTVYDMITQKLTHLNELPSEEDNKEEQKIDLDYLGSHDPIAPVLSKFAAG